MQTRDKIALPKQYQQGYTEFYKLKFFLTPDVLIPRPETELLVDEVLSIIRDAWLVEEKTHPLTVIDVGTGSGCIAISIAKNAPNAKIIATDISEKALEVAKKNAQFHKVENQIIFLKADLLSWLHPKGVNSKLDVIVTNLPYIPTARLMYIDPMVRDFEPKVALDGGRDGFELYRKLLKQLASYPSGVLSKPPGSKPPGGWISLTPKYLFAEIDYTHGELAVQETLKLFPKASVEVVKDLAHMQRILKIRF